MVRDVSVDDGVMKNKKKIGGIQPTLPPLLSKTGYLPHYRESPGKAEVDFIIRNKSGMIIPIEVKSSENVRSKSLAQYCDQYPPEYAIRISTKNFGFDNSIKLGPLYALHCINE